MSRLLPTLRAWLAGVKRRLLTWLLPAPLRLSLASYRVLRQDFGHLRSLREGACVARDGSPLPWYTYPAIEYLEQIDVSGLTVFEFGSGNSTRYWAGRCRTLISVEDDPAWYARIRPQLPPAVDYRLVRGAEAYAGAIRDYPGTVDVIAIDGNYRLECAIAALERLSPDGFIILDNSDWHERTAAVLQQSGLLHVCFAGFGPMLPYTWATSVYFARQARPKPRFERHPMYGTGSIRRTEAQQRGEA